MGDHPFIRTVERVGNNQLARECGVSPQYISKLAAKARSEWKDFALPAELVLLVSLASGYQETPHILRPDLYPHPNDGLPEQLRNQGTTQ